MNEVRELERLVINNDYCIGCGACTIVENSPFRIQLNEFGNYVAYIEEENPSSVSGVLMICPFSNESLNEDQLSRLFLSDAPFSDSMIGRYHKCYAGYVTKEPFREKGSSGGLGKWLGYKLLSDKIVDFYIHVTGNRDNNSSKTLFQYTVVKDAEKIKLGSKSSYYPVTLDKVLEFIKNNEGRYAITGLPCFIKAIRLISNFDPVFSSRIAFTIGIVCGGLKSANHAKLIGWQLGIDPDELGGIDFRVKTEISASKKIYKAWDISKGEGRSIFSDLLFGVSWHGHFMPNPCFYCDDVLAETADISLGDAWLPRYEKDPRGTNIVVIRNLEILKIFNEAIESNEISFEEVSAEEVVESQAGGLRQRRDALSYRIGKKEGKGEWYPIKRIKSNDYLLSRKRVQIYNLREQIALESHKSYIKAYKKGDLLYFKKKMMLLEMNYFRANHGCLKLIRYLLSILKQRVKGKSNFG